MRNEGCGRGFQSVNRFRCLSWYLGTCRSLNTDLLKNPAHLPPVLCTAFLLDEFFNFAISKACFHNHMRRAFPVVASELDVQSRADLQEGACLEHLLGTWPGRSPAGETHSFHVAVRGCMELLDEWLSNWWVGVTSPENTSGSNSPVRLKGIDSGSTPP